MIAQWRKGEKSGGDRVGERGGREGREGEREGRGREVGEGEIFR